MDKNYLDFDIERLKYELINYKKISIFSRDLFLLLTFERVLSVFFDFLKESFDLNEIGIILINENHLDNKIIYQNMKYKSIDEDLRNHVLLLIKEQESFFLYKNSIPIVNLFSRGQTIALLIFDNELNYQKVIQSDVNKHLCDLVFKCVADALRGCYEVDNKLNQNLTKNVILDKERLIKINEKLEAATNAKSEFLTRMSHEMRTPLNVLLGLLDTIAERITNEEDLKLVEVMKRSGGTLLSLICDILDLSKVEANEMKLDLHPLDFYNFIDKTVFTFQEKAKQKNIILSYKIDPLISQYVICDSFRLNQILTNLISNALKFTSKGSITLKVLLNALNDKVIFELIDTGIGLTKDQMAKIFQPFTQADETISRTYGGTGLGLSIVKKLVNLMGGDILVRDNIKDGAGSIFFFDITLPKCLDFKKEEKGEVKNYYEELKDKSLSILIVDDSVDNQLLIKVYFKNSPFKISYGSNGKEGIELFQKQKFDIIFMDIQMPVIDGTVAMKTILSIERQNKLKHTPIVAFTADVIVEHNQKLLLEGFDDILTKPVKKTQIYEYIYKWTKFYSLEKKSA